MMRVPLTLLLLSLFSFSAEAQRSQEGVNSRGIVESIELSGIPEGDIAPDVRDSMQKLVGQRFDQNTADDLVNRIQTDKPGFIVTTRLLEGSETDKVKVIFVVENSNEQPGTEANVNSRYLVERVEVQGFDESKLSQPIRDDMKNLVGAKLNQDEANQIRERIESELRPRYYVTQRVTRGTDRQHIVVVYEVHRVRWIPFTDFPDYVLYHSKQNFSASIPIPIDFGSNRLYFGIVNDQDQLLERFAGIRLSYENVNVGTQRLGLALLYARYHERWQPATLSEFIYRERTTFDPSIIFAFDTRLRLSAGLSLSDLELQFPSIHSENSNAVTGSMTFRNTWQMPMGDSHSFDAGYDLRAGNHTLDSEFIFTRHFAHAQYVYGHDKNRLSISFIGGLISGGAPLFERFSLGNTSTLRGWNKFDVAPLGGDRVVHTSLQYGFGGPHIGTFTNGRGQGRSLEPIFHIFYDVGAVGDHASAIKARHSVGFGIGKDTFFMSLGFPIRSSRVQPTFLAGFRF
jgi:hypothetical protein